jgi:hypothetical protein
MRIAIALHDWNGGGTERVAMALAAQWLAGGDRVMALVGHDGGANGAPARGWAPPGLEMAFADPPVPRSALSRRRLGPALAALAARERPDAVLLPGNFHLVLARAFGRCRCRHGSWASSPTRSGPMAWAAPWPGRWCAAGWRAPMCSRP